MSYGRLEWFDERGEYASDPKKGFIGLEWIVFPRRIDKLTAFGIDRPPMASDLSEVMFFEGEAQRLQKLSNLIGGLIGKIRGEGKVKERWLVHGLHSMFIRF